MTMSSTADAGPAIETKKLRSVLPSASPFFVATCMIIIAGSLSLLLYMRAGLELAEAGWIGLAALLIMVLAEFFSARSRERAAVESELQQMARLSIGLDRSTSALGERVADIETTLTVRIEAMIEERAEPLETEITRLEAQIEELNDTVAALRFAPQSAVSAPAGSAGVAEPAAWPGEDIAGILAGDFDDSDDLDSFIDDEEEVEEELFPGMSNEDAAALVRRAVEVHGPEIHLQTIVTLPQRRVRYYESLARLRDDHGKTITPDKFIPVAERFGIMPIVDNAVLFHSVQIMRKMARKHRETGIFCNISTQSLSDSEFFQQFVEFMGENRNLSGSIIFEFTQAAFIELSPVEMTNLEALADLGFRFSLDNVTRLDFDGPVLADRGVRYIKIDADLLIQSPPTAGANIHAADMTALLARVGIDLIATRIETEAQVVDILDLDVKYGQGNLFSAPRPVRSDVVRHSAAL